MVLFVRHEHELSGQGMVRCNVLWAATFADHFNSTSGVTVHLTRMVWLAWKDPQEMHQCM
jgi:hypothetical protein